MKEKILEAFKALGFEMEELEGMGYGFQYESVYSSSASPSRCLG